MHQALLWELGASLTGVGLCHPFCVPAEVSGVRRMVAKGHQHRGGVSQVTLLCENHLSLAVYKYMYMSRYMNTYLCIYLFV
jgi:hypothetical protein